MNVLFVTHDYPPLPSGVGDYTARMEAALRARGHRVRVLTRPEISSWGWRGFWPLVQAITREPADLWNVQYVPHAYGWAGINLAFPLAVAWSRWRTRRPLVVTFHELWVPWSIHPFRFLQAVCHRIQTGLLAAASNRIIVVTERQRRELQRLWGWMNHPVSLIFVGSNVEPQAIPEAERRTFRSRWAPEGTKILAGFSLSRDPSAEGRLERLVRQLRAEGLPVQGLQMGHAVSADGIASAGYLPPEDISRALLSADVIVNLRVEGPSTRHSSMITAMAHGCPILAWRNDADPAAGFWENSGVLRCTDADLLGQARRLLTDDAYRRTMGEQARAFAARYFAWPPLTEQVETELRTAAKEA